MLFGSGVRSGRLQIKVAATLRRGLRWAQLRVRDAFVVAIDVAALVALPNEATNHQSGNCSNPSSSR